MITLGILSDFTDSERAMLQDACDLVNKGLGDPDFLSRLSSDHFDNTTDDNVTIVIKLTAPIIITRLYCEDMGWIATHWHRTVAEESPDGTVTFNRAYFDGQSIPSLANTILHEACHCVGYSHRSSKDYLSVPYEAGNEVEAFEETTKTP